MNADDRRAERGPPRRCRSWHAPWLASLVLGACGHGAPPAITGGAVGGQPGAGAAAPSALAPPTSDAAPRNGFAASSPLNQPLPEQIPLAPNSEAIVANLAADRSGGYAVWPLMTDTFSAPIYIAGPDAPLQDWRYDNCTQASGVHAPFAAALGSVPTLPDMVVSNGSDGEIAIYQPSTDTYWDFWRAQRDDQGRWSACWGGKIDHYSKNPGVFATPLGATATGLALGAFLIRIDELERGHIDHAINIATVRTRANCQSYLRTGTTATRRGSISPARASAFASTRASTRAR